MITSSTIKQLKSHFRGELIVPGDEQYDAARAVFNAAIDRRPALIACCVDPDDVIQAVHFARKENLLVAVRGTGHNVAGFAVCDGNTLCSKLATPTRGKGRLAWPTTGMPRSRARMTSARDTAGVGQFLTLIWSAPNATTESTKRTTSSAVCGPNRSRAHSVDAPACSEAARAKRSQSGRSTTGLAMRMRGPRMRP